MAIEVTDALVRHIAGLSRIAISPAEAAELKKHFEKILAYVAAFEDLDTSGVDPTFFSVEASNIYREDACRPSLPVTDALASAPASRPPYFIVPRIVADAAAGGGGA
jgi:aspartyl-tRNA(Asn)/glutamyl-tRNA(Gln) amidotransferase subunit C